MTKKYMKEGKELKLVLCYKNNPLYDEVKKRASKCLVHGKKLYCLPNTMFIIQNEGVELIENLPNYIYGKSKILSEVRK